MSTTTPTVTVMTAEQSEEFEALKQRMIANGKFGADIASHFYELGRKHGRESADAENALIQDAVEQTNAETQDKIIRLVMGALLLDQLRLGRIAGTHSDHARMDLKDNLMDYEGLGYRLDCYRTAGQPNLTTWVIWSNAATPG